jgi:valyl-tRNA synthetase
LLNAQDFQLDPNYRAQAGNPVAVTPLGEIFLAIDTADKTRERERLDKEIAKVENDLLTVEAKLQNSSFIDRAPTAVVEEHRQRLADFTAQLEKLRQARAGLK